ncbi:MAG: branched-chain amino acid ABC transporter permease [Candidatus Liptonbacteria bacterium]|nr:branched-chain amino acid ABC transporter permease [Candidatus Liptonbacteria bacterium]
MLPYLIQILPYLIHILTFIAIYLIVNLAYAIPVGYTGMLNLGHVGLLAIGAYTSAILITSGYSFWLAFPLAALLSGIAGFLLALPARRIKGDYYALMTLGFVFVVNAILLNWQPLTRGPLGITGIERPEGFISPERYLILTLIVLAATAFFVRRLVNSPFGKALEAVRDDDLVAESLGKPTAKLRVISLSVSAVIVGIAGALLAPFIQFINPQIFSLDLVIWLLAALVVGGLASFPGAIVGTVIIIALFESVRFLPVPLDLVGALRLAVFSIALLAVVLMRPRGILGRAQLE